MARLYRSLGSEVTTFSAKSWACPEVHWLRNGNDGWTMALATRAAWRRLELVGERELEIHPPGTGTTIGARVPVAAAMTRNTARLA